MLRTGRELLRAADAGGYAVGAFNIHTLEMLPAVLTAAEELQAPVILQFTYGSVSFIGAETIGALVPALAHRSSVPVAIHLDHGAGFDQAVTAIRSGFTSVMIDASKLPLDENIVATRQVVAMAHAAGLSVEAEIGRVGGTEDEVTVSEWEAALTLPEEAARFAAETGVDYLAVAFGTAHGFYKGEPRLDLDRLAEIDRQVEAPLVMHGGSGVPDEMVRAAVARGVRKVNVATELKDAWARALRETLAAQETEIDPRKLLAPPREAVKQLVAAKMQLLGCVGRG